MIHLNKIYSPAIAPIRYIPSTELIFWLTKDRVQPNFKRSKDSLFKNEVWQFSPKPNPLHPAPYPEELPKNIMMNIDNKDNIIVYDPFAGTGTTCKVAKEFGFNFIGSEIHKEYFDIAITNTQ